MVGPELTGIQGMKSMWNNLGRLLLIAVLRTLCENGTPFQSMDDLLHFDWDNSG